MKLYLILNALHLSQKEGAYYQLDNASISTLNINKNKKVRKFHINDYTHLILEVMKQNQHI
jgi:hypothetical protein